MHDSDIILSVIFTTLLILLLIACVAITIIIASRQRTRQEKAFSEAQLHYQQELRTIESEVRENTLNYIASELHDNIGQQLTVMNLQMEKEKLRQPTALLDFETMSQTLHATIRQVRLLSHALSHDLITEAGFQSVIREEAQRLHHLESHIVEFKTDDVEPTLTKDMRLVAFRIFQEAINNSLRHSGANNIKIELQGKDHFQLNITDDGKGFDKETVLKSRNGLGLKNMVRRAKLAGLECRLITSPGEGCIFTITCNNIVSV